MQEGTAGEVAVRSRVSVHGVALVIAAGLDGMIRATGATARWASVAKGMCV